MVAQSTHNGSKLHIRGQTGCIWRLSNYTTHVGQKPFTTVLYKNSQFSTCKILLNSLLRKFTSILSNNKGLNTNSNMIYSKAPKNEPYNVENCSLQCRKLRQHFLNKQQVNFSLLYLPYPTKKCTDRCWIMLKLPLSFMQVRFITHGRVWVKCQSLFH